jgi:hypothetical protein
VRPPDLARVSPPRDANATPRHPPSIVRRVPAWVARFRVFPHSSGRARARNPAGMPPLFVASLDNPPTAAKPEERERARRVRSSDGFARRAPFFFEMIELHRANCINRNQ